MRIESLDTPVATVDLDAVDRNIGRMQSYCDEHGLAFRPHIKTHKLPAIAHMQVRAGAVGITCPKLGEAEVMAAAGLRDILLTFPLVGAAKAERLAVLARDATVSVVGDSETVVRGLSAVLEREDAEVGFLVECDTGFRRTGVQTPDEAFALARTAMKLPGLRFKGLMTFPNRDPDTREFFERALALFEQAGIPVPVVSGGGTPALATVDRFPMLTEHRAGTCVYNDAMVVSSGTATWEQCAMRVRATVVSRPTDDRGVLDAGSKVLTSDLYHMKGYGHVMEYPEAHVAHLSEEHAVVDFSACAERPKVGEVVNVVPNHCCVVTNMVDEVYGVRAGRVEVVWPVAARGRVQ